MRHSSWDAWPARPDARPGALPLGPAVAIAAQQDVDVAYTFKHVLTSNSKFSFDLAHLKSTWSDLT